MERMISDGAIETASVCNINYLFLLIFIIGVWGIYEETFFSNENVSSGSAKRHRVCLGAQDIQQLQIFKAFTQLYFKTSSMHFPPLCSPSLSEHDPVLTKWIANAFIHGPLTCSCPPSLLKSKSTPSLQLLYPPTHRTNHNNQP